MGRIGGEKKGCGLHQNTLYACMPFSNNKFTKRKKECNLAWGGTKSKHNKESFKMAYLYFANNYFPLHMHI